MNEIVVELTPEQRERRHKKNIKRREKRKRAAARAKLPPIVAVSRGDFAEMFGLVEEHQATSDVFTSAYDAYADSLIAECQAKHRKFEFPIEPKRGLCFPSRVIRHKGGGCAE